MHQREVFSSKISLVLSMNGSFLLDSFLSHLVGYIHKVGSMKLKILSTSLQRETTSPSALFHLNFQLHGVVRSLVALWICSDIRSFWDVLWSCCSSGIYATFLKLSWKPCFLFTEICRKIVTWWFGDCCNLLVFLLSL